MKNPTIDPITLSIVQSRLDHIAKQMGWVMIRAARSPIFNQSHDFSCFITDRAGTLLSQADGIPIHTGGGGFAVRAILEVYEGRISEGDVFLLSDPFVAGGNHLPDWVIARPVFVEETLIGFACNRAHQSDIGGGAAGTYNSAATEIFHEGIRLPVIRLVEQGRVLDDIWRLLLLNTRCPDLMDGDIRAMLGSTEIGVQEMKKLAPTIDGDINTYFALILDYAEKCMRRYISELPDGVYRASEGYTNDCFEERDIPITVAITIKDDEAEIDFTGTAPQIKGFKNSSLVNTFSAVYAAFGSFFDADMPRNEGAFRPLTIIAPKGTLVNALYPAPVTMCTVFPAHEIIHICWWALGQAKPEQNLAGWGKNSFPVTAGADGKDGTWVLYHWAASSGAGAVRGRDGFNQMGTMVSLGALTLPNAEMQEQQFPVKVIRQEFREDGGGSGQFRGGTGVDYEIEIFKPAEFSFRGEGIGRSSGRGVENAGHGIGGELTLIDGAGAETTVPQYAVRKLGPLTLRISSPGGGGYGAPKSRDPEKVLRDFKDGVVSQASAENIYGVVIENNEINREGTMEKRKSL